MRTEPIIPGSVCMRCVSVCVYVKMAEEIKRRLPESGRLMSSNKSIGYLLKRNRITARHSIKTRRAGER